MTADQIKKLVEQLPRVADEIDAEPYSIPETSAQVVRQAATALSTLLEEREALFESANERELALNALITEARNVASQRLTKIHELEDYIETLLGRPRKHRAALTDRAEKERSEG